MAVTMFDSIAQWRNRRAVIRQRRRCATQRMKRSGLRMTDKWDLRIRSGKDKAMASDQPSPSQDSNSGQAEATPGRTYYEDFFSKVLDDALERKKSLEQRGITVVTTASTLVTLIFTIVSFVLAHVGSSKINPHALISGSIDLATVLFVAAAVLGLAINIPVPYGAPDPRDLAEFLFNDSAEEPPKDRTLGNTDTGDQEDQASRADSSYPANPLKGSEHFTRGEEAGLRSGSRFLTDNADAAGWEVALARVKLFNRAKQWNQRKASLLFLAILCEVVAIGSLAWGVHRLLGF